MNRGIRIVGEYTHTKNMTEFQCVHGHIWTTKPNNVLSGKGCPECARKNTQERERLSEEEVVTRLSSRGITMIGKYINGKKRTEFECKNGHHWITDPASIFRGADCPHCSNRAKLSKDVVNDRLIGTDIKMIGEYTNNLTKSDFQCGCGEKWSTTPNSVMSGHGCPSCAHYGFNPGKPAWIYVLKFANYIKYGITNNLKSRMSAHLRVNGQFDIVFTKSYDIGRSALEQEKAIKRIHGGRYVTKDQCPDGWTETLSLTKLQSLLETLKI